MDPIYWRNLLLVVGLFIMLSVWNAFHNKKFLGSNLLGNRKFKRTLEKKINCLIETSWQLNPLQHLKSSHLWEGFVEFLNNLRFVWKQSHTHLYFPYACFPALNYLSTPTSLRTKQLWSFFVLADEPSSKKLTMMPVTIKRKPNQEAKTWLARMKVLLNRIEIFILRA